MEGKKESCEQNDSGGFVPLDLKGFTYQRMGGRSSEGSGETLTARNVEWMLAWLKAQPNHDIVYNPQPYTQLAKILNDTGHPAKANEFLYNMREYERSAGNTSWHRKVLLTLQWALICYGHANWQSMIWFALVILIGVWACGEAKETSKLGFGHRLWYCVDRSIPTINLGTAEDVKRPSNWVAVYFYFLQIVCFVLTTFVVAGLTVFTK